MGQFCSTKKSGSTPVGANDTPKATPDPAQIPQAKPSVRDNTDGSEQSTAAQDINDVTVEVVADAPIEVANAVDIKATVASTSPEDIDRDSPEFLATLGPIEAYDANNYEIERKIAKTLCGACFIARDRRFDNSVVIKSSRIRAGIIEDPLNELKYMRVLSANHGHPSIVRLLASQQNGERLVQVMEFGGADLFTVIQDKTRTARRRWNGLEEPLAKNIFLQLLQAVEFMHNRGVVHLDLSLENVLLSDDDDVKVIDLGQARYIRYRDGQRIKYPTIDPETKTPYRPGKKIYRAPEILFARAFDGVAADVWSCGVILFIILTGNPPFELPVLADRGFNSIYAMRCLSKMLVGWSRGGHIASLSTEAMELLQAILCPASQRLNLTQIMAHPWLEGVDTF